MSLRPGEIGQNSAYLYIAHFGNFMHIGGKPNWPGIQDWPLESESGNVDSLIAKD